MKITIAGKKFEATMEEIPIKNIIPDFKQPRRYEIAIRKGEKEANQPEDIQKSARFTQLVRSIVENQGISIPLVVEKISEDNYKLLEGDRRLGAANYILNNQEISKEYPETKKYLSKLPCIVIQEPLNDGERLRLLAHLHVQHVSWRPTGKSKVISDLLDLTGDDRKVASIMGVTKGSISKLQDIDDLSEEVFASKKAAAKSYASEFLGIRKSLIDDEIKKVTKFKVEKGIIKSPLQIRDLRRILVVPEARETYLKPDTTIGEALKVAEAVEIFQERSVGLENVLQQFILRLKSVPLEELMKFKDDEETKKTVNDCINLLEGFSKYL